MIVAAMVAGALTKGVTGSGLPTIAIPVMAGFLGVERAVVVMAIPTVVTNSWLLWEHRHHAGGTRHLPGMLACGAVGVGAGVWALTNLHARSLSLALAGIIVAYVAISLLRPAFALPEPVTRWLSPPMGFAGGVLQGATGIAGPLVATYVHAFRLPPRSYVFAITAQFQLFAAVQVAVLAGVGLYTRDRLVESALALVPVLLVLPLGMRLARRLDRRRFDYLVLGVLVLMGGKLVVDALGA
ncbi:MAG: sulfite exporter TauE/SafE family protein [Euzebyales bacterium]|nr:sulfite exporter TauE/SafE family protein [Euzebyales bacterium]